MLIYFISHFEFSRFVGESFKSLQTQKAVMMLLIFSYHVPVCSAINHVSYLILTIAQQDTQSKTYFSFAGEENGIKDSGNFPGK